MYIRDPSVSSISAAVRPACAAQRLTGDACAWQRSALHLALPCLQHGHAVAPCSKQLLLQGRLRTAVHNALMATDIGAQSHDGVEAGAGPLIIQAQQVAQHALLQHGSEHVVRRQLG